MALFEVYYTMTEQVTRSGCIKILADSAEEAVQAFKDQPTEVLRDHLYDTDEGDNSVEATVDHIVLSNGDEENDGNDGA